MDSNKEVMTLANSIIGVSVLAMPFCFKECGIILSLLLLVSSSILSRLTCYFLLKSAVLTRRRNYEFLAFHVYGSKGKFTVELFIIGFLLGTCVAFFVVMGDLSPQIISSMIGAKRTSGLRITLMCVTALLVVLPLGLLRNVESLEFICKASIGFYLCLVIKVIAESTPHLLGGDWVHEVRLWRPEGVLQCLPIFSMALFCQTQLFEVFGNLPNTPLDKMTEAVRTSITLCTLLYASVGFFGYVAFNSDHLTGNVLLSLEPTISSEIIKLGFVLSVALSFPLVIFPCRASLYSLFYRSAHQHMSHHDMSGSNIPDNQFKMLTFSIVLVSLFIGVLLPNIETVLGLVGATIGVTVCITLPAMLMHVIARHEIDRLVSKATLAVGIVIMVLGTFSHMASIDKEPPLPEKAPVAANMAPLTKFAVEPAVNTIPPPEVALLPRVGVGDAGKVASLLKAPKIDEKLKDSVKESDKKSENKNPQKNDISVKEIAAKAGDDKKDEDNAQALRKMEDLKEVIDKNKQEQEKLLREQHQILEGLKEQRREAEIERKKQAVAQNASIEIKKVKTPMIKEVPLSNQNFAKQEPKLPSLNKLSADQVVPQIKEPKTIIEPPKPVLPEPQKEKPEVPIPQPVQSAEKKVDGLRDLEVKLPEAAVLPRSDGLKESAKDVNSQQEAPVEEKVPQPVGQPQASKSPLIREPVKEARLQPPLPLPPNASNKEPVMGAVLQSNVPNSDGANRDSGKLPQEAIPFAYQKKSVLSDTHQRESEIHHREKREDKSNCEGSDSFGKKRAASSLLPDLQQPELHIKEHVQPQIKDSVL